MTQQPDLAQVIKSMPFAAMLGIELVEAKPEVVRANLSWNAQHCTLGGVLHVRRTSIVAQTDLFDENERRVAQATQT